jgi:hypothetical protein
MDRLQLLQLFHVDLLGSSRYPRTGQVRKSTRFSTQDLLVYNGL